MAHALLRVRSHAVGRQACLKVLRDGRVDEAGQEGPVRRRRGGGHSLGARELSQKGGAVVWLKRQAPGVV